jgi:hypothetical protein
MWLLIFTEISGTYTTECGALTLASIMTYIDITLLEETLIGHPLKDSPAFHGT